MAIGKGVSENIAEQFPVFSSISIGLGRIFCGIILDLKIKNKINFIQFFMLLAGLNCFAGLFASNQTHMIVYIWIFGVFDGIVQAAVTPALRVTTGLDFLSEAYSLVLTADAIALLLGPPFVGELLIIILFILFTVLFLSNLNIFLRNTETDLTMPKKKSCNWQKAFLIEELKYGMTFLPKLYRHLPYMYSKYLLSQSFFVSFIILL